MERNGGPTTRPTPSDHGSATTNSRDTWSSSNSTSSSSSPGSTTNNTTSPATTTSPARNDEDNRTSTTSTSTLSASTSTTPAPLTRPPLHAPKPRRSTARPFAMQGKYASQDDWEGHRATVTRLYLDDQKTLKEVKKYMEETHLFFATEKMYKTRIKKWALDKNNKMAEVAYMVRLKRQRDAVGKRSAFTVRNRPVDWSDIERYLHRTPGFQAKIDNGQIELGTAALGIVCRTPSPDPAAAARSLATIPSKLPTTTRSGRLHEEALHLLRNYLDGAFEQGIWVRSPADGLYYGRNGVQGSYRISQWYEKVEVATGWESGEADAVRLLNAGMDDINQIIKDQEPSLLYCLIQFHYNLSLQNAELTKLVSPFITEMCNTILGPTHPMTMAWTRITQIPMPDLALTVERTAKFRFDYFATRMRTGESESDWSTLFALYQYAASLAPGPNAAEVDRVTRLVAKQLAPRTPLRFQIDCQILFKLSSLNIRSDNLDTAGEMLETLGGWIVAARGPTPPPYFTTVISLYLRNMGLLYAKLGRKQESRAFFRKNYRFCLRTFGPAGYRTLFALTGLLHYDVAETPEEDDGCGGKFYEPLDGGCDHDWRMAVKKAGSVAVAMRERSMDSAVSVGSRTIKLSESDRGTP
ncbi:hypothetical protein B0T19DRAFT_201450 [Cercophora scortea]|uniref:Clr5 domain-containing protein n=1 Tax=Cercophora scortea TaxID=314031 RepID=A0AAE0IFH3_9PEZI|nr:hypothetical protein B0T19DRAFT_201450 [Cercophora scortea]